MRAVFFFILALVLGGCGDASENGPAEIKWDRDVCERCRMLISDRHFAAQLRDGEGKVHKFDDFGDLMGWVKEQNFNIFAYPTYVTDAETGEWLDAKEARYTKGHITPMGFGVAAHATAHEGDMSYATVAAKLFKGENCGPEAPDEPLPK